MKLVPYMLFTLLAVATTPAAAEESAMAELERTLNTIDNVSDIDGRWVWANMSAYVELEARNYAGLEAKVAQFCAEDRSLVMAIESVADGFDIGVIDAPPGLHWQYRRNNTGNYTLGIEPESFYGALGYDEDRPPSEAVIAHNERNNGPVTVIRPSQDILMITQKTGFDLYLRCGKS
ncbi:MULTISPECIES: hypothetical protein [unclassified Devosia]|uniref:hypothetical protein n=1 Tax=unclassified Devosia TaxID=196773 RepID=UPI000714981F|nr:MULTISPECIES: hypothetical protein [unclassified Devosia]KQN71561.1 hypothetical protein ASE94_10975 [Devosia sp. Leaf64]KQT45716.1 hypothetical protein ASG47_12225 [Devosia sp. Leaf420]